MKRDRSLLTTVCISARAPALVNRQQSSTLCAGVGLAAARMRGGRAPRRPSRYRTGRPTGLLCAEVAAVPVAGGASTSPCGGMGGNRAGDAAPTAVHGRREGKSRDNHPRRSRPPQAPFTERDLFPHVVLPCGARSLHSAAFCVDVSGAHPPPAPHLHRQGRDGLIDTSDVPLRPKTASGTRSVPAQATAVGPQPRKRGRPTPPSCVRGVADTSRFPIQSQTRAAVAPFRRPLLQRGRAEVVAGFAMKEGGTCSDVCHPDAQLRPHLCHPPTARLAALRCHMPTATAVAGSTDREAKG